MSRLTAFKEAVIDSFDEWKTKAPSLLIEMFKFWSILAAFLLVFAAPAVYLIWFVNMHPVAKAALIMLVDVPLIIFSLQVLSRYQINRAWQKRDKEKHSWYR